MFIKIFLTATLNEGEEIIKRYHLNLIEKKPFLIFKNEDKVLIISKIGKIEASIASTYILQKFPNSKIINIGICSSPKRENLYKAFRIKSVIDKTSEKKISLNIKKSLFTLSKIATYDKAVLKTDNPPYPLIDMEAYGFLKASMKFLKRENIFIYKVVSDILCDKIPNKDKIRTLIKENLDKIEEEI